MAEYNNQVDLHVKQSGAYPRRSTGSTTTTSRSRWSARPGWTCVPTTRDKTLLLRCEDTEVITGDTARGYLRLTEQAGVIEIYIPHTTTDEIPVGAHVYDLFVNYKRRGEDDSTPFGGEYHVRSVISGMMVVHPAVTDSPPETQQRQLKGPPIW